MKKTHCTKIINNLNSTPPKILIKKPENHWTNQPEHPNWEYYIFIANQLTFSAQAFYTTKDWKNWDQVQKNHFLLKELVNNSVNFVYQTPEEIKILNESVTKGYTNNFQKGKKVQTTPDQQ